MSMETTRQRTVIGPRPAWYRPPLHEVWQYRDLLLTLAKRDVKLRYRQTALGVFWVVAQPLLAAGIFTFVFGNVAKLDSEGHPYFVFSYAGLLGWNAFATTLQRMSNCLVLNSQLVAKIFFPRLVLPVSTLFATLIDFTVSLCVMAVLMVITSTAPGGGILLLPVWLAVLLVLATGGGLVAAGLMVRYRDIGQIIPVVTQLLMYISPVAYATAVVPARFRDIYFLNPLAGLLEAFRWSLLGTGRLNALHLGYSVAVGVCLLGVGIVAFNSMERRFADVI
jgi:lipopolysaccharide transport system permease protein